MHENPFYEPYWDQSNDLEHYGILGMKWGIRKYQNADGTLTEAGKKRYAGDTTEQIERSERRKAKVAKVAKTAAKIAAITAATTIGGYAGARLITAQRGLEIGSAAITALSGNKTMETTVTLATQNAVPINISPEHMKTAMKALKK